jgi:2-polyprenyl-3-methyl-5-hydroxy-6-metoxy-1,4-benzoquinol methylase
MQTNEGRLTEQMAPCNICRYKTKHKLRVRSDGWLIQQCARCGLGAIAPIPEDLSVFYNDSYYYQAASDTVNSADHGYEDYAFTAEHGTAWAAALIPLIRESGALLDVGCVDGYLLNKLGSAYDRFGIEVNATMRGRAAASGITVLGDDLLGRAVIEANTGRFDIVTCVAVFEHLRDFRGGFEAALQMLKPNGVLIFEVPLISTQGDNTAWYTSSLEHVYYPTDNALRYLVEQELGASLIGAEIPIKHYASTYIGIVPKRSADAAWLSELFGRIRGTGPAPLSAAERVAKMELSLVHAANGDSSDVLALAELSPKSVTGPLLKRLGQLWELDRSQLASATVGAEALEATVGAEALEATRRAEAAEALAKNTKGANEALHELLAQARQRVLAHARAVDAYQEERQGLLAAHERDSARLREVEQMLEALRRSRTYRLQQAYVRLYAIPVVGPVLRHGRHAVGRAIRAARRRG